MLVGQGRKASKFVQSATPCGTVSLDRQKKVVHYHLSREMIIIGPHLHLNGQWWSVSEIG